MHYPDYGDPRLTKDGAGYIYWRGRHVEHYSHDDAAAEIASAKELTGRCEHLESLGIEVNVGSAVWNWNWFADLTPERFAALPPLVQEVLRRHRDLYEDDDAGERGRFCWLESQEPEPDVYPYNTVGHFTLITRTPGPEALPMYERTTFDLLSDGLGGFYHPLVQAGWRIAQMGQPKDNGCCYATTEQLLAWINRKVGV